MRVAIINAVTVGSTGKIMFSIAERAREKNMEVRTISSSWARTKDYCFHSYIGFDSVRKLNQLYGAVFGKHEELLPLNTHKIITHLKRFSPDIIHLHNLHGCYLNHKLLFNYLKTCGAKIIWTLHDCWPFTGRCAHFTMIGCEKWKTGCHHCKLEKGIYPASMIDTSKSTWKRKKEMFTGVPDMTIVTPSEWLAGLVKQSFLKDYPVKVINNGIDLSVFKPTESSWREEMGLTGKKVVLGVAFGWGRRKGLDVFIELARRLDDSYRIVLVGTNENVDRELPDNIISIHRTHDQAELARIYSAADVFANPTREENYPTVNMEALACGTPVITFRTGGSPEIIDDTCGMTVDCDDVDALLAGIKKICEEHNYTREACLAKAESFDMNKRFNDYIELYETAKNDQHNCTGL